MHDLLAFPDSSRVWIYQADRALPSAEIGTVNEKVVEFTQQWTSHNKSLKATGALLHDQFLVLVTDESKAGASGCSIDSSVRFVKEVAETYSVDFFDRLHFTYLEDESVRRLHRDEIAQAYKEGRILDTTLFFDNLVSNKGDFLARWLTPFGESWIKRFA